MPWPRRANIDALKLRRDNHELPLKLLRANSELRTKQLYAQRLEFLLHQPK
jgi:hypothetical protein